MTPITATDQPFDPKATTLPVLRYLVALADHGHFGRAAEACHVSQPTLSEQVARWEKRLGVQAFERSAKGVRPTVLGTRMVEAARSALDAIAALEGVLASAAPPFFGPLRLGVIPTIAPWLLPLAAPAIERSFPELDWPVREGTTAELLGDLDQGRLDVALLAMVDGVDQGREVLPLYHEPFLAAVPAGHALAGRERIAPADLAAERLLVLDEGHCLRDQALEVCRLRAPGSAKGGDYRAASLETLRQLVALGRGVTVLPALTAAATAGDGRVATRPLGGTRNRRTVALAWRRGDGRGAAYGLLAPVIRASLPRGSVSPA